MNKPTCEELSDMKSVHRVADDSWRHGSYIKEVFYREEDNTYWRACYRLSTDGETNELYDGTASIIQVEPIERVVVDYQAITTTP